MFYVAAAVVLALFAIPLGIGAVVRWLRFRADAVGLQTHARLRDLRIQSGVAVACTVLMTAALVTASVGWEESRRNLGANIEARYEVSEVNVTSWNGTWAEVDLVDGAGRPMHGIEAFVDENHMPELVEPDFGTGPADGPVPLLELR